jgi:hypothetical protein
MEMKAPRKAIVASLAAVLSLGVASGVAWAQDNQDNLKPNDKSKIETQHKAKSATGAEMKKEGQAGGGMKAEGNTQMKGQAGGQMKAEGRAKMKGEAGGQMKAEGNRKMKGEGQNAQAGAKSGQNAQMKAEESGPSTKKKGSRAEMKSETQTSG